MSTRATSPSRRTASGGGGGSSKGFFSSIRKSLFPTQEESAEKTRQQTRKATIKKLERGADNESRFFPESRYYRERLTEALENPDIITAEDLHANENRRNNLARINAEKMRKSRLTPAELAAEAQASRLAAIESREYAIYSASKHGAIPKRRISSRSQYAAKKKRVMKRKVHSKSKPRSQAVKKIRKTRKDKGVKRGPRKVRSTTKTRSLYAATKTKTVTKGKGVKNYLSGIISNVSDSVKNTGKAVLSPITKKTRKA